MLTLQHAVQCGRFGVHADEVGAAWPIDRLLRLVWWQNERSLLLLLVVERRLVWLLLHIALLHLLRFVLLLLIALEHRAWTTGLLIELMLLVHLGVHRLLLLVARRVHVHSLLVQLVGLLVGVHHAVVLLLVHHRLLLFPFLALLLELLLDLVDLLGQQLIVLLSRFRLLVHVGFDLLGVLD